MHTIICVCYNYVYQEAHEAASLAPDFHEYAVGETSFFMDHHIPGNQRGGTIRLETLIELTFVNSSF